jgi:lipoate-protein ligase A
MSKLSWYLSPSTDPYYNLALEDQILKSIQPEQKVLLLYRNDPCVVIGRFQNPWRELDMKKLGSIHLVRRQSGGGTVYHDQGNLCFSFIYGERDHHKDDNNQILISALKHFNLAAEPSQRSDLVTNFQGIKKFSGSAFKQKKDSSFHHGTLLFEANLKNLGGILRSPMKDLPGKGIQSNPSAVVNLKEINPGLTQERFIPVLVGEFEKYYQGSVETLNIQFDNPEYLDFLKSWTWVIGETPEFTLEILGHQWKILKGKILEVTPMSPEVNGLIEVVVEQELRPEILNKLVQDHPFKEKIMSELEVFFNGPRT